MSSKRFQSNGKPLVRAAQEPHRGSPAVSSIPPMDPDDVRHLETYGQKLAVVRDRVTAVVKGYSTGLYLHGPGGVSKSHTVLETLSATKADYVLSNSRMTGRGLFDALQDRPDSIHVLEDMESLMSDRNAQGVLRSALWGQPSRSGGLPERLVTWSTFKTEHKFTFTGGLILVMNRPTPPGEVWEAIVTRIAYLHLQPSDNEVRALMRSVARRGHRLSGREMTAGECLEVCEFLIERSLTLRRRLDMRLLVNSFADYLQWQESDSKCHWRDLVVARLRERPVQLTEPAAGEGGAPAREAELRVVSEIVEETPDHAERHRLWAERTGKSASAFDRRLRELGDC